MLAADSVEGLVGAKPINTGFVDLYHTQQSALPRVCHEDNFAWLRYADLHWPEGVL